MNRRIGHSSLPVGNPAVCSLLEGGAVEPARSAGVLRLDLDDLRI